MITPLEIYMITELDSINKFIFSVAGSSVALIIAISFACCINSDFSSDKEEKEKLSAIFKKTIKFSPIPIILFFLGTIIPTTNQAAAMLVIPKVANSEFAKQAANLPVDLTKLAEKYVHEKLANADDKNKGENQ